MISISEKDYNTIISEKDYVYDDTLENIIGNIIITISFIITTTFYFSN